MPDRGEVVALRRAVHAVACGVERLHGAGQSEARRAGRRRAWRSGHLSPASFRSRSMSSAKLATRSVSRSALSRAASRRKSGDVALLGDPLGDPRVQRTRRPAQRLGEVVGRERTRAPVASRNQASTARTEVRSANSSPTPPVTGTPAATSANCTGASDALTRVSTATSVGAPPAPSDRFDGGGGRSHRVVRACRPTTRPARRRRRASSWRPGGGCDAASRSTDSTMPAGQR